MRVGRIRFGNADHARVVCEVRLAAQEVGTRLRVHAIRKAGVKRLDVRNSCPLDQKTGLQIEKLFRVLFRNILGLAEVLCEVVQFLGTTSIT